MIAEVDVEHPLLVGSEEAVEVAADRGARPGPGEEGREPGADDQEEDAPQRERQEVRAQQAAAVDDGAPGPADAAGRGEVARRQAAENVRQEVVGQVVAHLSGGLGPAWLVDGSEAQAQRFVCFSAGGTDRIFQGLD